MSDPTTSSARAAIREWRTFVLDRTLLLCFALTLLASTLALSQRGWPAGGLVPIGLVMALILGACTALKGERTVRLRQWALVGTILPACWMALYLYGFFAPEVFSGQVFLAVLVALVIGPRTAWAVWALSGAGCIAIGVLHGIAPPSHALADVYPASTLEWVRIVAVDLATSAASIAAVSYLCERMVSAVDHAESLRAVLEQQSHERICALERERNLMRQLQQVQRLEAMGTLAGGVAHDFNNLLVVIMGNADLVSDEPMTPEVRSALQGIQSATQRAASLTTQLLTLSRQQTVERSSIVPDEAIHSSVQMLRRVLPESIEMIAQLAAPEARIWLATSELDQIVVNLCINARDAMPGGGDLRIYTRLRARALEGGAAAQPCIELEIQDTGTGMDAATQERIFEPFFSTKDPGSGTGLGLSTVYGIVRQAGGDIEVRSSPGNGTAISILLPLYQGDSRPPTSVSTSDARQQRGTLLIADDDPEVAAVLRRLLSRRGYDLICCSNGMQALEELKRREGRVDLIICDAVMPKMGGKELHSAILKTWGEIPFLVCSGYSADAFELEFFSHPTRGFIAKPFGEQALQHRIQELLQSSKRLRHPK